MGRIIPSEEWAEIEYRIHNRASQQLELFDRLAIESIDELMNNGVARHAAIHERRLLQDDADSSARNLEWANTACARDKIGELITPKVVRNNLISTRSLLS